MSQSPRPIHLFVSRNRAARFAVGGSALLVAGMVAMVPASLASPSAAAAAPATSVDLGTAASFSVLAGTGVSNTGAATVLALDLGLSPSGAIAGFPPGIVTGVKHDKDAAAEVAQSDRADAYAAAVAQTGGTPFAGDQIGATFHPGVHSTAAAFTNTGTMTLDADGDPGAVFLFQIGAAYSGAAATQVVLTDGALAHNVYWQVDGAVSLGAGAKYVGTFLATGAVALGEGASLKGRILTPVTVALANSPVTKPIDDLTAPVVSLDGGATRSVNDTTPSITGTTDEPVGRPVRVTVAGQTLSTSVGAGGAWAVGAAALNPGAHAVTATVTDPSQNTGSATQVLTVDTTPPTVSIQGGAATATNDTTPTISGTTDQAGSNVSITVADQTLTTRAGVDGAWSIDTAALAETSHGVVATVVDTAHNTGSAGQVLTVDVTVPVVAVDGGAARSTVDTSPWIYGTTAEKAGTAVIVRIGGQTLHATVLTGGAWGVSATTLSAGARQLVATVTDAAQNTGSATQVLTIGPGETTEDGPGPGPGPGSGPEPTMSYQPDAAIRLPKASWVGVGVTDGNQRVVAVLRGKHRSATFEVALTNGGRSTDTLEVHGTSKSRKFTVRYLVGREDVTRAVVAGTFRTESLKSGDTARLVMRISRTKASQPGDRRTVELQVVSVHKQARSDTVSASVRVKG